jgi:hypothetical protein
VPRGVPFKIKMHFDPPAADNTTASTTRFLLRPGGAIVGASLALVILL